LSRLQGNRKVQSAAERFAQTLTTTPLFSAQLAIQVPAAQFELLAITLLAPRGCRTHQFAACCLSCAGPARSASDPSRAGGHARATVGLYLAAPVCAGGKAPDGLQGALKWTGQPSNLAHTQRGAKGASPPDTAGLTKRSHSGPARQLANMPAITPGLDPL